jgi:DNA-binding transcriptional ArsR family regulator
MSEVVPSTGPVIPAVSWDADVIFPLLADPVRRRLLLAVARGGGQPASVLKDAANRRLDATLKHLTALRAAGLLVTRPDKQDGRRMLYGLAPGVPLVMAPEGAVLDFGFCVLRLKG